MGTHHRGPLRERRALDAYIRLSRCAESVAARVEESLARAGLTVSQFGVLEAVYHLGPMCPGHLARKLLRSAGNLTLVLRNLERDRLIRKRPDPDDGRTFQVELTPRGRTLIRSIFPRHAREIARLMGALTPSEQLELGRLSRRLGLAAREVPTET